MGIKKELNNLIVNDKIKEALEMFSAFAETESNKDLSDSLILLTSRFNRNQNSHTKNLLTSETYSIELNRIVNALKEYMNSELDEEEEEDENNAPAGMDNLPKYSSITNSKSVFISYSHSESNFAKKVHASLKGKGVDVIIDYENLGAGDDLRSFIDNSIKQASNTISIISSKSLLSSWVSIEVIKTMHSETIANKKFIAAFIDDSFFKRSFTNDALDKIEAEIKDIHIEMDERKKKNRNMDDLYSELKRYSDLEHHLPAIVQRLKESYSVDIRDDVYDIGIENIIEALI